jgi:hypothetical protein
VAGETLRGNKKREKEERRWAEGGIGNISEREDGDNERDQLGLGAGSMIKDRTGRYDQAK